MTAADLSVPNVGAFSWLNVQRVIFSVADQGLSVSGMFLVNVALARTVTKEEYGMFALSYSVFTFVSGLHNAAILEPYTVYGAGRYSKHGAEYRWLMWRSNAKLGVAITAMSLLVWLVVSLKIPSLAARSLLGLALASGVLLTAALTRRTLYVQRKPQLAALLSLVFFVTVVVLLRVSMFVGVLNGLSAFLIAGAAWIVAGMVLVRELPKKASVQGFVQSQPHHWWEHWRYARWVLATAFVFQLTTQGYYWLVAALLSLREVAQLRAIYLLVSPVDQVFVALSFLILPTLAFRHASARVHELFSLWKAYVLITVAATLSFAILARIFGKQVIHLVYGGKFDDLSTLFATLAFLPLMMGIGNTMNDILKSIEKPNVVLYAYIASGTTTLLAGIPFVVHFGLRGAVYAMLISAAIYTSTLAIGFFYCVKHEPHPMP